MPDETPDALPASEVEVGKTRDGREIPIEEMYRPHMANAIARLVKWRRGEKDPQKRGELKSWIRRMKRELRDREKEWQARRRQGHLDTSE